MAEGENYLEVVRVNRSERRQVARQGRRCPLCTLLLNAAEMDKVIDVVGELRRVHYAHPQCIQILRTEQEGEAVVDAKE